MSHQPLTGLIGGDVYGDMLGGIRALITNSVDSLYLEAVESVSPQVAYEHPGLGQTQLPRDKVHVVVAVGAGAPVGPALLAHYVVDDVAAAARLPGAMPLQDHGGFIHNGDHVPRAGWDTCECTEKRLESRTSWHKLSVRRIFSRTVLPISFTPCMCIVKGPRKSNGPPEIIPMTDIHWGPWCWSPSWQQHS